MPSINFDMNDVKPLLSSLGLGQAPPPPPKMDQLSPPPMPTPAQAGFNAWSADPMNQQKIAGSLTMPGTPIIPPNVPAALPNAPAPIQPGSTPPAAGVKPLGQGPENPTASVQPLSMTQDMAANPDAYQHNNLVGRGWKGALMFGIPAALQSAAGGLTKGGNPTAGLQFIDQQVQHDAGVPQANSAIYDTRNIKPLRDAAALADTQSQTAQRTAQGNKADSQSDDMKPFVLSPAQATAINHPELAGTTATMRDYSRLVGMAGNNSTSSANNTANNATKVATTGMNNDTSTANNAANNTARQSIAGAANKTKALIASMHDQTSRANNENTVANKGTTGAGGFKVPADVTKRAALASNVLENADAVDGILAKRPDIVGAAGGRYSNVQQMIGSNDPDIQALGVRMHNIALASNGAHGVRAQQAIQKTEDELFSNFKAGPQAISGALGATRGSMQTFLNDENNFSSTGKRTAGAAPSGGSSVTTPDGLIHSFPNAAAAAAFKKAAGL